MKQLSRVLLNVSFFALLPTIAVAGGTYYNGNTYQSPQSCSNANNCGGYYNNYSAHRNAYGQSMNTMGTQKNNMYANKKNTKNTSNTKKSGFLLNAGAHHEFADWNFEMKKAGSKLRYDGLRWNVIDGTAAYYFGDTTPMQVIVGARYGKQFGEIAMIDDDLSAEAMWDTLTLNVDGVTEYAITGTPAVSVGTGKGGTQMGFNAAFGLTDFFKVGNMKITPSVGYRYFKHKVETKGNYGLMVDILSSDSFINCIEVQDGEIQCSPYIGFADANGDVFGFAGFGIDSSGNLVTNENGSYVIYNNTHAEQLDVGNTYYYEQAGVSHSYETEWVGPYLALDMEYVINNNNTVNMGVEFGLPKYNSKGDQPYRFDWAHPTSVEDKGDFGDAYHLGLNGDWSTRVSDTMCLTFGFTYDYYQVKKATANTYLNVSQYEGILEAYQYYYNNDQLTEEGIAYLQDLKALKANGWTIKNENEIESIYKAMGIRVGLNIKF